MHKQRRDLLFKSALYVAAPTDEAVFYVLCMRIYAMSIIQYVQCIISNICINIDGFKFGGYP